MSTDFICGVRAGTALLSVRDVSRGLTLCDTSYVPNEAKVRVWTPVPEYPDAVAIDFLHAQVRLSLTAHGTFAVCDRAMFYASEQFQIGQWRGAPARVLLSATASPVVVALAVVPVSDTASRRYPLAVPFVAQVANPI